MSVGATFSAQLVPRAGPTQPEDERGNLGLHSFAMSSQHIPDSPARSEPPELRTISVQSHYSLCTATNTATHLPQDGAVLPAPHTAVALSPAGMQRAAQRSSAPPCHRRAAPHPSAACSSAGLCKQRRGRTACSLRVTTGRSHKRTAFARPPWELWMYNLKQNPKWLEMAF